MTPPARTQAAIEALSLILAAARGGGAAADTVLQRFFAERRYMGSGDRRAVRELVYAVIRSLGEPPSSGRAAMIAYARAAAPELLAHFGAGGHAPGALLPDEPQAAPGAVPAWLAPQLDRALGPAAEAEAAALLGRAPLDLRVNTLKATREEVQALLPDFAPTPRSPIGLRGGNMQVEAHPAHARGLFEVQDEGSQLAALACGARPGMTVIDLCAGAGGKTLALAASMENRGQIIACDTDARRLGELGPRAARAGVSIAVTRLLDPPREADALTGLRSSADIVLIDAPCSGTGTWRRNPEARWRLTPERLVRLAATQDRLLRLAAPLVRPGGRLVYVVCSVLPAEGPERIAAFVEGDGWTPAPALAEGPLLTPHRHGTDGFFVAALAPIC